MSKQQEGGTYRYLVVTMQLKCLAVCLTLLAP